MLENKTIANGPLIKKVPYYKDNEVTYSRAIKKESITQLKGVGSQLTLLSKVVEQIGDQIGLDTPEFAELKSLLESINTILSE